MDQTQLTAALSAVTSATECARQEIMKHFPDGTRVAVRLAANQMRLSPGTVLGAPHIRTGWGYASGYINVELDNAKPHSRQRVRSISIENAQLLEE